MFYLFFISLISSDTINSIRNLLINNQYKAAYTSVNSIIIQQGALDAQSILFFLRGYASVKLEDYNQGISDLSRFLAADKDNNQNDKIVSYTLRSLAYLRTGHLKEAAEDSLKSKDDTLIKLVRKANILYNTATSNESSPRYALNKYAELIKICFSSKDLLLDAANLALSIGDNTLFIEFSEKALKISPKDGKLLEMMSRYHFSQYQLNESRKYAKKCLDSFSESSKCTALLKSINNYEENEKKTANLILQNNYDQARETVNICQKIVKKYSKGNSPLDNQIKILYVKILIQKEEKEDAIECLNGLIKAFPEKNEFLIERGKLLIDFDDYSGAISDFQTVKKRTKSDSIENLESVKLIEKVSILQEKQKNMNYYALLGLKNGANITEIKKAYRSLAVKWHPDRFLKPLKKKEAEKKMMMINMAYEVLSDETKKKLYDFDLRSDDQNDFGTKDTYSSSNRKSNDKSDINKKTSNNNKYDSNNKKSNNNNNKENANNNRYDSNNKKSNNNNYKKENANNNKYDSNNKKSNNSNNKKENTNNNNKYNSTNKKQTNNNNKYDSNNKKSNNNKENTSNNNKYDSNNKKQTNNNKYDSSNKKSNNNNNNNNYNKENTNKNNKYDSNNKKSYDNYYRENTNDYADKKAQNNRENVYSKNEFVSKKTSYYEENSNTNKNSYSKSDHYNYNNNNDNNNKYTYYDSNEKKEYRKNYNSNDEVHSNNENKNKNPTQSNVNGHNFGHGKRDKDGRSNINGHEQYKLNQKETKVNNEKNMGGKFKDMTNKIFDFL